MNFDLFKDMTINGQAVVQLSLGGSVVWKKNSLTPITKNYLRFDATTNDVHIGFNNLSLVNDMEYSFGYEEEFVPFTSDGVDIPQGKSIWLRASGTSTSNSNDRTFIIDSMVECHGDVRSLLNKTNFEAADLTTYCFKGLFMNASYLTTAPELPATTMVKDCYRNMFQGCTSLTTAPELPATTMINNCYNRMFNGCTNLNSIKCMARYTSAGSEITSSIGSLWLDGVSSTGTFYKNPEWAGPTARGASTIPTGWTIVDWI